VKTEVLVPQTLQFVLLRRWTIGLICTLSQKNASVQIYATLDTGADITIISMGVWLEEWPLSVPTTAITGVEGHSTPMTSQYPLQITFPEGQEVSLKGYVMQLPKTLAALIGRDVLSQIGVVLTTTPF